jgi:hypothetical protein
MRGSRSLPALAEYSIKLFHVAAIAKQAQMPLRGSGGDENGRLTLDTRIGSNPAPAIF